MASTLISRSASSFQTLRLIARTASPTTFYRAVSTLPNNEHIYVHDAGASKYILSYLSTTPPIPSLAIGTTTKVPPTPESFVENREFMSLVHEIIKEHAPQDPEVQAQAALYASQAGSALGSGGVFFPQHQQTHRSTSSKRQTSSSGGGGAGGASSQGGIGGAGRGGWIHVSDQRNPPDYGRVAWPEDIFGSLEIDAKGEFVAPNGRYQESGTYRVLTSEGTLGLSAYLRQKLVDRVSQLDAAARTNG